MTTIRDFYEGGMILFNVEAAYRYEEWLARMLKDRFKKWWDKPWWLRSFMLDIFDQTNFSSNAFHVLPGDPLVVIPDVPQILLLKSRFLHRLRLQAVKMARRKYRGIGIPSS